MGAFNFIKNLLGQKDREILKSAPIKQSLAKVRNFVGVPDEYERWEDAADHGVSASYFNPQNELFDFLNLYQIHPWVFSCVNAIATAVASIPYRFKDKKGEEVKNHDIDYTLARPNPHMVWYELQEVTYMYL